MWNDSRGNRGFKEIETCLLKFIKTMKEKGCREFFLFRQLGRSKLQPIYLSEVGICFLHSKSQNNSHVFRTSSTQYESDSIHSCVESVKKGKSIYVLVQYIICNFGKLLKSYWS